jgi:hypothetical protein
MDKIKILNPSLWTNFMIDYLYRLQVIIGADEIRRSQYSDTSPISVGALAASKTKGVLRTKIRQFNATRGLPKCRKAYGDGDPIVLASTIKCGYTTRVMPSE